MTTTQIRCPECGTSPSFCRKCRGRCCSCYHDDDPVADRLAERAQWSVADVATYLGIKPSTVTAYHARGQMPPADGRVGRSPWWWDETIREWRTWRTLREGTLPTQERF